LLQQEASLFGHIMNMFPKKWNIKSYSAALASGDEQSSKEELLRPISVLKKTPTK